MRSGGYVRLCILHRTITAGSAIFLFVGGEKLPGRPGKIPKTPRREYKSWHAKTACGFICKRRLRLAEFGTKKQNYLRRLQCDSEIQYSVLSRYLARVL